MSDSKILIVDDDPLTRALFTGWMDHLGIGSLAVGSIADADVALATGKVEVLLSDVHLPGNQQLRWVEEILAHPQAPAVILIAANPELETTLRAANLAIAGFLIKPLDLDPLQKLCERLLQQRRRQREFLALSKETERLLIAATALDPALRDHLLHLARHLQDASVPNPRAAAITNEGPWRDTIIEAIAVLEKTKHAFRSKDLGALRVRLEETLRHGRTSS